MALVQDMDCQCYFPAYEEYVLSCLKKVRLSSLYCASAMGGALACPVKTTVAAHGKH